MEQIKFGAHSLVLDSLELSLNSILTQPLLSVVVPEIRELRFEVVVLTAVMTFMTEFDWLL